MLQKAVSDYELAQTYPAGSKERTDHLAEALKQFDDLYKNYRTQMAGLTAQMWQAKCYEEQGKIGEAIGIYKSLLEQPDPRLRPLQRFVGYFYIVALAKRKEHALAADEAVRWLKKYSRREELRSPGRAGRAARAGQEHRRPDGRMATDEAERAAGRRSGSSTRSRRSSATPRPTRTRRWPCSRNTSRPPPPGPRSLPGSPTTTPSARPTRPSPRATGTGRSSCSRRPSARPTRAATSTRPTGPGTTWHSATT